MKKIKLLVVSDDIRSSSGVGIQCRKLLQGLNKTGRYSIVEIAGSLIPQPPSPIMFEGIKLYPTSDGYGNQQLLRTVMNLETPDIVLVFSDPRFFEYLFVMDNEIRSKAKLILYHTWDNAPFPKFNLPWYSACDRIVMLSDFSHKLMSQNGVKCDLIQHGFDPSEFYPLPPEVVSLERAKIINQAKNPNIDFIIFWNNRNMMRKRPGDLIQAFKTFSKIYPNSLLVMHTNPNDPEGTNLIAIIEEVDPCDSPIMVSSQKITSEQLNILYNISDVSINIAFSEGFGLCVGESLLTGTPVVATRTGGMTEQMSTLTQIPEIHNIDGKGCESHTEETHFGILLDPEVRNMYGHQAAPYIYGDYVSEEQIVSSLSTIRSLKSKYITLGEEGREHIIQNFHINSTVDKWDKLLQEEYQKESSYTSYKLI